MYSFDCGIDFIPIVIEKDYKADGWLGFLTAGPLRLEHKKVDFNDFYEQLVNEIGLRGKEQKSM